MCFPGWQSPYTCYCTSWLGGGRAVHNCTGREPELCIWTPASSLHYFDWDPSPVVSCNHEYNSVQWILSVPLNDQTWGKLFKLAICATSESSLIRTVPLDLALRLTLNAEQGLNNPRQGEARAMCCRSDHGELGADTQAHPGGLRPRACSGQEAAHTTELILCPNEWGIPQISMSAPCWWPDLECFHEGNKKRADRGQESTSKGRNKTGCPAQATLLAPAGPRSHRRT